MADKAISELIAAAQITPTDMFVLEQNGTAKKLTGQILLNWLTAAADGHGGIQSIAKLSTSGLADTYRITLADTTYYDFVVTNGRGVSSIAKTSTSGLVDTYTISYNDGTTGTFTVTNGAKGDKGDNAYIWVKYASQKPTSSAVSLGDIPDDWIGIYTGTSATAPTSYSSYKWYEIKGKKGDTGDPAQLVSTSITYQVGSSGTIIPSGSWSPSVPVVPQGKYLWTRQEIQFNSGNPVTSYTVARFGVDGTGSVSSVCNIGPDENGNVPLVAADIGALSTAGGTMNGTIDMNGQRITGLNAPSTDNDAVPKLYVDALDWANSGTVIPREADLDTYRTPGKYYVSSTSNAGTIINAPIKNDNYVLYVIKRTDGASLQQIIVTLNSALYIRGCASDGNFREWVRMANTSYVDEAFSDAQESIVQQVITALGTPVFGTVGEGNVITLTGDLEAGTYTLKYEGVDGSKQTIGTVTLGETVNQIPISTDANGSVFNGVGYQSGYRISSSGEIKAFDGQTITGFIPCKSGDTVRFTADMFDTTITASAGYNVIAAYDANKTFIQNAWVPNNDDGGISQESDNVWVFKPADISEMANTAFIRFCMNTISSDSIVTINQKIS